MNDKGYSSTLPIYDQHPHVTHKHTHTHTCVGPRGREHYNAILQGEKKRESFSDECSKDSNPVKGDTQPNTEEHLYGEGWVRGVVMT